MNQQIDNVLVIVQQPVTQIGDSGNMTPEEKVVKTPLNHCKVK